MRLINQLIDRFVVFLFYWVLIIPMGVVFRKRVKKHRAHVWHEIGHEDRCRTVRIFYGIASLLAGRPQPSTEKPWIEPQDLAMASAANYESMERLCKGQGIPFVMAFQPYLMLTDKPKTELESKITHAVSGYRFGYDYAGFAMAYKKHLDQRVGGSLNHYLDLQGCVDNREDHIFLDRVHLSDKGYSLLATQLADFVETQGIINGVENKSWRD